MTLPWEIIDFRDVCGEYESQATTEERQIVEEMYAERYVIGTSQCPHILSCSLFCKPVDGQEKWGTPSRTNVSQFLARHGTRTWWDVYASPLLKNLHRAAYTYPDIDIHLYLAADLEWMASMLALPQVVVHVMRHSSLDMAPGAMWRFLGHDEPNTAIMHCVDVEDDWTTMLRWQRVAEWRESGLGVYRYMNPIEFEANDSDILIYRPLGGGFFALRPSPAFSMRRACEVFTWLALRDRIPTSVAHPERGQVEAFGHRWPHYGFDETFLQRLVYPALLARGVYTHYHVSQSQHLFPLDIREALEANSHSIVAQGGF